MSIFETASSWPHRMIRSMHVIKTARFMQKPFGHNQIGGAEPYRKSVIDRTEARQWLQPIDPDRAASARRTRRKAEVTTAACVATEHFSHSRG
jgi:hypothetical protein